MYKLLIRPLLFLIDPETVHHLTFRLLRIASFIPGFRAVLRAAFTVQNVALERKLFGLTFRNPVGLAAGFDKDAALLQDLSCFGFGFIEVGTLTPKPQDGNERPRLFRLPKDKALINRMGFNNKGVDAAVTKLKKRNVNLLVGGNIGKNKSTANNHAYADYAYCFEALYDYVDYFVVNVSSPNTPGLRDLQDKKPLESLLNGIKKLSVAKPLAKPVLLKISPDLTPEQLDDVIEILLTTKTDGVIATNTTTGRDDLVTSGDDVSSAGAGGLSGKPLSIRSTHIIRHLRRKLGPGFPIIGVGGIMNADDAITKLDAGADLVQIYTGFIYEGPSIVKKINKKILDLRKTAGAH
jgi:dihydroorotate dehydrogenase